MFVTFRVVNPEVKTIANYNIYNMIVLQLKRKISKNAET